MSSLKTYLINDNGEMKMKQHQGNDQIILKNTLDDKRVQRRMSAIARNIKEKNFPSTYVPPQVVQSVSFSVKRNNNVIPHPRQYLEKTPTVNLREKIVKLENEFVNVPKQKEYVMKESVPREAVHKVRDAVVMDEKQMKFFNKICKIVGIHGQPHGKTIPFERLDDPYVIKELYAMQEKMREVFPSSKLTALHTNAVKKQHFPGVNMVRQIFKEMGYRLKPITYSEGYLGSKKLIRREYQILKL